MMDDKDKKTFSNLMLGMADNFRDTLSKEGLSMRWELLKEYSIDQIEFACKEIIKTRKYTKMPPIAEFIEKLKPPEKTIAFSANEEADKILDHLRTHGHIRWPVLKDPITRHLMTKRWPYEKWAKDVLESELKWWHKEFVEAYNTYRESGNIPLSLDGPEEFKQIAGNLFKEV